MRHVDVAIVGGGIVGCACAYFLAKAGFQVTLLEKGALGSGASRAGMSHVVTWEEPIEHLELARKSQQLYEEHCLELMSDTGMDIEYRRTGSTVIVESPQGIPAMKSMIERLQQWGVNCEFLTEEALHKAEPRLASKLAGGAFFPDDAMVNPLKATQAFAAAARKLGADIQTFKDVSEIKIDRAGRIDGIRVANDYMPVKMVIIAAGAWSSLIEGLHGVNIPVKPRKGIIAVTQVVPEDFLSKKVIVSAGYMDSIKIGEEGSDDGGAVAVAANIQQVKNGNLLLGSTRQFAGFNTDVDVSHLSRMISRCIGILPSLKDISIIRTWSGLRPSTPDMLPLIGPVQAVSGLFFATGHEGIGITEAPVTGWLLSLMLMEKPIPSYVTRLSPERFAFPDR